MQVGGSLDRWHCAEWWNAQCCVWRPRTQEEDEGNMVVQDPCAKKKVGPAHGSRSRVAMTLPLTFPLTNIPHIFATTFSFLAKNPAPQWNEKITITLKKRKNMYILHQLFFGKKSSSPPRGENPFVDQVYRSKNAWKTCISSNNTLILVRNKAFHPKFKWKNLNYIEFGKTYQ